VFSVREQPVQYSLELAPECPQKQHLAVPCLAVCHSAPKVADTSSSSHFWHELRGLEVCLVDS
jgi:hypothetical protein